MTKFTREVFLRALDEWARYPAAFRDVPAPEQSQFLKEQGFASWRDLLTHVAAWWEEARGIISDTIKNGDKGGRKYDLDAFNAASLKRHEGKSEQQFMAWYDSELRLMIGLVSGLTTEQLALRRVGNWLNAVLLEHLKEHGFDAPRFLVLDMLEREWGEYRGAFVDVPPEQRSQLLQKQGYTRFRDVLAHIIAWWEQGIAVIQAGSAEDPCDVEDVDVFNAQAVARFADLPEARLETQFEETRLTLASLVDMLPDEVLTRPNIQSWLRADVLDHYYEHAL